MRLIRFEKNDIAGVDLPRATSADYSSGAPEDADAVRVVRMKRAYVIRPHADADLADSSHMVEVAAVRHPPIIAPAGAPARRASTAN